MKRFFILMCMALLTTMVSAQVHRADTLNERVFEAKVSEMVYRLHITDEQKSKFTPIYRRYSEEMIAAWRKNIPITRPTTTEEAVAAQKQHIERQQRAQAIRLKYVDELATVLDAQQLNRFFDVESQIQQKLKARRNHAQGKRKINKEKKRMHK